MYITHDELRLRTQKLHAEMRAAGCRSLLLRSIPAQIYLTGSVFQGFTLVHLDLEEPIYFPDRPTHVLSSEHEQVYAIRKPEQIPSLLSGMEGIRIDGDTAVELGTLPTAEYFRLQRIAEGGALSSVDGALVLRQARILKTATELSEARATAERHAGVLRRVGDLYRRGMTDQEWQHAIEYEMRRSGSIGLFRAYGPRMEIFMGNLIAGDNAGTPAPYDFAMGGAGVPAMPFGANGTVIEPGMTIMVDMAGNYGTYMSDITRTYALGEVSELAQRAHQCAIELHDWFGSEVHPGMPVAESYQKCMELVERDGLGPYFMGTEFQSKFVGHGLGIEINEPPVLTPKWPGTFEADMVIAFEPKFVIPGTGPVGVENTYIVTQDGVEWLAPLPMEIIQLPE